MRLRELREEDVGDACALLEAAFCRPDEARLLRDLVDSDDLAAALIAVGTRPVDIDPGVTAGGASPSPALAAGGRGVRPGSADEPDRPVLGVAVLAHLVSPRGCVGLGPLAVSPDCRDLGIGKALIGGCVERARRDGHKAVFVLGQPPYYTRFGFSVEAARPFRSEYPAEFLMALELEEGALAGGGELRYPPAYAGL